MAIEIVFFAMMFIVVWLLIDNIFFSMLAIFFLFNSAAVQEQLAELNTHIDTVNKKHNSVEIAENTHKLTTNIKEEYISDQIRNVEFVSLNINGEVCPASSNTCFIPKMRLHESGDIFACEKDGMQCYILQR